jgi:general secretion pathway protein G
MVIKLNSHYSKVRMGGPSPCEGGAPTFLPDVQSLFHAGADRNVRAPVRAKGFSLIELLLVLVILGVLAALVVPRFSGRAEQARVTAAQSQLATFSTALDAFEVDNGYYPRGSDGLLDLIDEPQGAPNWRGPYLNADAIPLDPWGNPYIYESPGKHNPRSYDLMSLGPDGQADTEDDITNWTRR